MQFKHPEFLYALFALIIPILVHLFQLRRFQKVDFTNVQFLKSVIIQTRKSSQIKKWLTLLARLLALAAIIIAFAQPFLASEKIVGKKSETVIYLDNSFSMQAKGPKGPLFKRAVQELLTTIPEDQNISLFTNNDTYRDVSIKDIQNDLLQLEYSSNQMDYDGAYLKAKQLLSRSAETLKRVIMISDFQQKKKPFDISSNENITHLVQLRPVSIQNISVDSIYLESNNNNDLLVNAVLSTSDESRDNIPVALHNNDKLIAKTSVSIPQNGKATASFQLDGNTAIDGLISIEEPILEFDNTRYFNINPPEKIRVVAINESDDQFIKKIFTQDEFDLISSDFKSLNYNDLSTANMVILNEIVEIPVSLSNALQPFAKNGGVICMIPATEGNLNSYQQFINSFGNSILNNRKKQEKKITTINFSHPLYQGVFDSQVKNFQYPKVNSFYTSTGGNSILNYEDGSPFLYKTGALYQFTAAINTKNSNFKNSPLIVPTLYNIGKQSLDLPNINYVIGRTNSYDVNLSLGQDGIVSLVSQNESCIPLQQTFNTKVRITTDDVPATSGIYTIKDDDKEIQKVSYNYSANESNLKYHVLSANNNYDINNSITDLFEQIQEENRVDELWKWFVIFALLFLIIEILLLKYLK